MFFNLDDLNKMYTLALLDAYNNLDVLDTRYIEDILKLHTINL